MSDLLKCPETDFVMTRIIYSSVYNRLFSFTENRSIFAYSHRDTQTREEDLVHRFLDGLRNDDIRFAVEFHKDPKTIDEAVYYCVEYDALRSWIFEDTHSHKIASKQGRELYKKSPL